MDVAADPSNTQVPPTFNRLVDAFMKPLVVDTEAVRVIFSYMLGLSKLLLKKFANSDVSTLASELRDLQLKMAALSSEPCMNTPNLREGCIMSAAANIMKSCRKFFRMISATKYHVTDDDIRFVQTLMCPDQKLPLTFSIAPALSTDLSNKYVSYFRSHQLEVSPMLIESLHSFSAHVDANPDETTINRIVFFSTQDETITDIKSADTISE
jgi:hypothetical protein